MGHLRENGYPVNEVTTGDVIAVKRQHGVPPRLESCHTALVSGYVLEGHVPADLIDRLLAERPRVAGLAVPGMPIGSPGMDVPGQPAQRYEVLAFDAAGQIKVFATR